MPEGVETVTIRPLPKRDENMWPVVLILLGAAILDVGFAMWRQFR